MSGNIIVNDEIIISPDSENKIDFILFMRLLHVSNKQIELNMTLDKNFLWKFINKKRINGIKDELDILIKNFFTEAELHHFKQNNTMN